MISTDLKGYGWHKNLKKIKVIDSNNTQIGIKALKLDLTCY